MFESPVVEPTIAVFVIDEPVKLESMSTVNVLDVELPAVSPPGVHDTVPAEWVQLAGGVPVKLSPVGRTSVTDTFTASAGPALDITSVMVVVPPANAGFGENVLVIERSAS